MIVSNTVFREPYAARNRPERIVTFGAYLRVAQTLETHGKIKYVREERATYGTSDTDIRSDAAALEHTRLIDALNKGRKWARERFVRWFDPLLADDIALCIVPSHDPFNTEPPIRLLAQAIAAAQEGRRDATDLLVRHAKIKRIVFGGPSTIELHHESIRVEGAGRIAGRNVLLLDDIAKSGNSLRACRELLYEAGANTVQATALGRVADSVGLR